MKTWIWEHLADPVLRRVAARIDHLNAHRPHMHDGASWRPVATLGHGVRIHRDASLTSPGVSGALQIGDFCHVHGHLWLFGSGTISLGHHSFVGPESRIWSTQSVRIGANVLISHLVDIHDSNSHSLDWRSRREEVVARFERGDHSVPPGVETAPVVIEDDVWIGLKSSVFKGVTIGRGAVVAAGSVVTKDVPPFTMVAGNPAQVVKDLPQ
jgi:acetyltransferase-like isoleucine patch superfamily enzyme